MKKPGLNISSKIALGFNILMILSSTAQASSGYFPHTREAIKSALHTDDSTVGKKIYSGIKRTARIIAAPLVGIKRGFEESFYYVPTFYGPMITYDPFRGAVYGIGAAGKTLLSGGLMPKSIRPGYSGSFESTQRQNY